MCRDIARCGNSCYIIPCYNFNATQGADSKMNQISRDELRSYMQQYNVDYSIGDLTPTICALHGVPEPADCGGTPSPKSSIRRSTSRTAKGISGAP